MTVIASIQWRQKHASKQTSQKYRIFGPSNGRNHDLGSVGCRQHHALSTELTVAQVISLVAVAFIGSCHSWKPVFFYIKMWPTLNCESAEKLDCELVQALTAHRTASWVIAPLSLSPLSLSLFPRRRYFATLFASLGCSQTQHLSFQLSSHALLKGLSIRSCFGGGGCGGMTGIWNIKAILS